MAKGTSLAASREKIALLRERVTQRYSLARLAIKATAWVVAAWIFRDMVANLAGRETLVALKFAFFGDWRFTASMSLAGAGCAWAAVERWLKHRTVKQMAARIKELETQIDPNRTSSRLTSEGKTNPKDLPS